MFIFYLYSYHVFLFNIKITYKLSCITVIRDHDNIHRITKNETWPSQLWDHDRLHFNLKQRWLNYPLSAFLSAAVMFYGIILPGLLCDCKVRVMKVCSTSRLFDLLTLLLVLFVSKLNNKVRSFCRRSKLNPTFCFAIPVDNLDLFVELTFAETDCAGFQFQFQFPSPGSLWNEMIIININIILDQYSFL